MNRNGTKEAKDERHTGVDKNWNSLVTVGMAAVVFIVLALAIPNSANAGVYNVSNVTELINAINMANDEVAHQGSDTIILVPGTYTLTVVENGADLILPAVTSEIVIYGNGSVIEASLTSGGFRIFLVGPSGNLSLYDLAVRRGASGGFSFGGGIRNEGTLTIVNCTVSNNYAFGSGPGNRRGAGIWNEGILKMLNSTVSQNEFVNALAHKGAGIGNAGVATIVSSTISGNLSERLLPPTDIWNESGGSVTLTNSILAGCGGSGSFVSLGYNLDSNGSCHLTGTGDRPNSNAGLGPLQNNGGPTETLALVSGSDAIDAGNPEGCRDFDGNLLTTDQRGFIRAVNGGSGSVRCDIGAYEFNSVELPPALSVTIDIKPGSFPNSVNPKSKGMIPVAILSTSAFDATTVGPLSVKFGPKGAMEAHTQGHVEDADGDGHLDLVLHFRTQDAGIGCGDASAFLKGETFGGQAIRGSDSIRTVGCE